MKLINLTQGKQAIIDDDDLDLVELFKWYFSKCYLEKGYARARPTKHGPAIYMHRFVMRAELKGQEHLVIDHIDRNGLNNQKSNLRLATCSQNGLNRSIQKNNKSGVPGVTFCNTTKKWKVHYRGQGRGYFIDFDDAVAARKFIEETEGAF